MGKVPDDLGGLHETYDGYIGRCIRSFGRGHLPPADFEDYKQEVYLRILRANVLPRCQAMADTRPGHFRTYLYTVVRSVMVNGFIRNTRTPTARAVGIVTTEADYYAEFCHVRLEKHGLMIDAGFEGRMETAIWLDQLERWLAQRPRAPRSRAPIIVTLPNGDRVARGPLLVLQLLRQAKDPPQIATLMHTTRRWVNEVIGVILREAREMQNETSHAPPAATTRPAPTHRAHHQALSRAV